MKKLIIVIAAGLFGLTGCGNNETPDKLIGHRMINPAKDSADSAQTAAFAASMAKSMASLGGGVNTAPSNGSPTTQGSTSISGPDNGFYSYSLITTDAGLSISFRWRESDGNHITGTSPYPLISYGQAISIATSSAKYFDVKGDVSSSSTLNELNSAEFDFTFTLNTIGDLSFTNGATLSGSMSGSTKDGKSLDVTYTNIAFSGSNITGGNIEAVANAGGITYTAELTFNSDGSADGTITSSAGYTSTVHINPDGTGYYTDISGKHDLT